MQDKGDCNEKVNHPQLYYYWQPPHYMKDTACVHFIMDLGDRLSNIHVFQWDLLESRDPGKRIERKPLKEGISRWKRFFRTIDQNAEQPHYGFLEFVRDDSPEQIAEDWYTFQEILDAYG